MEDTEENKEMNHNEQANTKIMKLTNFKKIKQLYDDGKNEEIEEYLNVISSIEMQYKLISTLNKLHNRENEFLGQMTKKYYDKLVEFKKETFKKSYDDDNKIKIDVEKYKQIIENLKNSILIYDKIIYVLLISGIRESDIFTITYEEIKDTLVNMYGINKKQDKRTEVYLLDDFESFKQAHETVKSEYTYEEMEGGFFKTQIKKFMCENGFDIDEIHHLRDIYAELCNAIYNDRNIDKSVFKQEELGHKSIMTTQNHYSSVVAVKQQEESKTDILPDDSVSQIKEKDEEIEKMMKLLEEQQEQIQELMTVVNKPKNEGRSKQKKEKAEEEEEEEEEEEQQEEEVEIIDEKEEKKRGRKEIIIEPQIGQENLTQDELRALRLKQEKNESNQRAKLKREELKEEEEEEEEEEEPKKRGRKEILIVPEPGEENMTQDELRKLRLKERINESNQKAKLKREELKKEEEEEKKQEEEEEE